MVFQSKVFETVQVNRSLLITAIMVLLIGIAFGVQIYLKNLKKEWRKTLKDTVEAEKKKAIVATTKKLTHDIRKPFTLIQATLPILENNRSTEKAGHIIPKLSKSLDGNLKKVNKTIEGLEVLGHENRLKCEPVSLKRIISSSLKELNLKNSKVQFELQINHHHCAWGDAKNLQLLFVNLLQNAIDAVKSAGEIWLKTNESEDKLSVEIGNSNAYLSEEMRQKIFEVFFSNKKSGRLGVGLCIAQKIANSHSSEIKVESCKKKQVVKFIFELTKSDIGDLSVLENCLTTVDTPVKPMEMLAPKLDLSPSLVKKFKHSLESIVENRKKPLKIALIDDEEIYRSFIIELIQSSELQQMLVVEEFKDPEELLKCWNSEYDLLLTDLDLQHPKLDGFELVSKIRQKYGFKGGVCIHSNIAYSQNFQKAKIVGANAYLQHLRD